MKQHTHVRMENSPNPSTETELKVMSGSTQASPASNRQASHLSIAVSSSICLPVPAYTLPSTQTVASYGAHM